jgi:hypothetical protein
LDVLANAVNGLATASKKKRKEGINDLESRKRISSIKCVEEKVKAIISTYNELPIKDDGTLDLSNITDNARSWINKQAKFVKLCLNNHHSGNLHSFLSKWNNNINSSSFSKKCCKGELEKECGSL